jgi:hypothetical protein
MRKTDQFICASLGVFAGSIVSNSLPDKLLLPAYAFDWGEMQAFLQGGSTKVEVYRAGQQPPPNPIEPYAGGGWSKKIGAKEVVISALKSLTEDEMQELYDLLGSALERL